MGLTGPIGPGTAWPVLQRAAARFAAMHLLRDPAHALPRDAYEAVIGGDGAVFERDDGPEHASAPQLGGPAS